MAERFLAACRRLLFNNLVGTVYRPQRYEESDKGRWGPKSDDNKKCGLLFSDSRYFISGLYLYVFVLVFLSSIEWILFWTRYTINLTVHYDLYFSDEKQPTPKTKTILNESLFYIPFPSMWIKHAFGHKSLYALPELQYDLSDLVCVCPRAYL